MGARTHNLKASACRTSVQQGGLGRAHDRTGEEGQVLPTQAVLCYGKAKTGRRKPNSSLAYLFSTREQVAGAQIHNEQSGTRSATELCRGGVCLSRLNRVS
eukprot:351965-Chlamydomonas_euryale.AAC.2